MVITFFGKEKGRGEERSKGSGRGGTGGREDKRSEGKERKG